MYLRSIVLHRRFALTALLFISPLIAGCSSGGTVALAPAPAGVQSWNLVAGGSAQSEALQAADYYPNAITINAGDSITWTNTAVEPHTVSIPAVGQAIPPGPPQPKVGSNVYDGTAYLSSGFFMMGATYTVMFSQPGTYKVYCLIHQPEMVATIVVLPAGSVLPKNQAQYTALGAADFALDIAAADQAVLAFPYPTDGNILAAGIQPGAAPLPATQSSVVRFLHGTTLDNTSTIAVGTTVTWNNISQFPHTVSFPILGQPVPPGPPTRPAEGASTYDGTAFVNSGLIVPGGNFSLKFTKAGTYAYFCLFHTDEGMTGTIVVK